MSDHSDLPLRKNTSFLAIWIGQAVSEMGGSLSTIANGWLVYQLTGSKAAIGSMWLIYFIPSLLVQLGIGPYLDRWDRKRVMLFSQWIRGSAFLFAFGMLLIDRTVIWPLYLVSLVNGLIQPLYVPASMALLPSLIPKRQLTAANASIDGTVRLMSVVGPPLGGVFVAAFGGEPTMLGVAAAYFISGVILLFCKSNPVEIGPTKETWVRQFMGGINYFRQQPVLLWLGIFLSFVQFSVGVTMVLNLPYIVNELNGTSFHYGLFIAGFPLGYFLGSLLVSRSNGLSRRMVMLGSLFLGGTTFIALAGTYHIWLAVAIEVAAGFTMPFFQVNSTTLYQRTVPNHLLGRVFSVRLLIIRTAMPLGVLLGSQLGEGIGVRPIYMFIGLLICTTSLLGLVLPAFQFLNNKEI